MAGVTVGILFLVDVGPRSCGFSRWNFAVISHLSLINSTSYYFILVSQHTKYTIFKATEALPSIDGSHMHSVYLENLDLAL
jgi:hypothetical protein